MSDEMQKEEPEATEAEAQAAEGEQQEEKEFNPEEIRKEKEALQAELERLKKEKSGVDKSVGQLQKKMKELEESKLSEQQLAEKRMKEEREALLSGIRKAEAEKLGLSDDMTDLLSGASYDEVRQRAEALKQWKEAVVSAKDKELEELRGKLKIDSMKQSAPPAGENKEYDWKSAMPGFLK